MTRFRSWLAAALFLGALAPSALAQANRVFVSARSGNDLNSCANILTPCQTFQGAVNQVNAGGSVIVLDTGGYGPVTITKALTIQAPEGIVAFIHPPSGSAITINAGASDVIILRGLSLSVGTGKGIDFTAGGVLQMERCEIHGFQTGISMTSPGLLLVRDTTIRVCSSGVVLASGAAGPSVMSMEHCRLKGNQTAVTVNSDSKATIHDCNVSGNVQAGLVLDSHFGGGVSGEFSAESCLLAHNGTAILSLVYNGSLGQVRVSDCTITDNNIGLWADGGSVLSRGNNTVEGNTNDTMGTIDAFSPK